MFAVLICASVLVTQDTVVLTLDQATARALTRSPAVAASVGAVRAPLGLRAEARWPFPDNPSLEFGRIRRRSGPSTAYDREWAVTQEIEIAGQWLARGSAASALVRSLEARVEDVRRSVALEARLAFTTLAIAERRAELTDSAAAFAERLAQFARLQFDAGEANRLEVNSAVLEGARARSAAERARGDALAAAADLARLLALPADSSPLAAPLPPLPVFTWASDSALYQLARSRRPDLRASAALSESAERGFTAARRALVPNLTVAALGGREGGTDGLLGLAVGIRIPVFHRQQAGIGLAEADREAARADLATTQRQVLADVMEAGARFVRARGAEQRFAADVLGAAAENVALTERALIEGEVSLTDVLVLRTTAVSAQTEYLEVLRDAYTAWFALSAALAAEPAALATLLERGQ